MEYPGWRHLFPHDWRIPCWEGWYQGLCWPKPSRNCYCQHYNQLMASQMKHMNTLGLSSSFVHPLTHKIKYKQLKASKLWLRLEKSDLSLALNSRFAEGNLTSVSHPLYSYAILIFIQIMSFTILCCHSKTLANGTAHSKEKVTVMWEMQSKWKQYC